MTNFKTCLLIGLALTLSSAGCVRRTMTFNTDPQGALVFLNDAEVGRTPVSVDFTYYGDYDIVYRKEGYQTLSTNHRIKAPWYQVFPIDFVSEVLIPTEFHDQHDIPVAQLEPETEPDLDALVARAREMRKRTALADD